MYCHTCKQDLPTTYRFCPTCRTRLVKSPSSPLEKSQSSQSGLIKPQDFAEASGAKSHAESDIPELPLASSPVFQGFNRQMDNIPANRMDVLKNILGGTQPDNTAFRNDSADARTTPSACLTSDIQTHMPEMPQAIFQRRATEYDIPDESWLQNLPLQVEYSVNRYILSSNSKDEAKKPINLELQIQQTGEPLVCVNAWMVINAGREHETLFLERNWEHKPGNRLAYLLPYDLKWGLAGGDILIDFYLACQFKERLEYFTFHVKHAVIPPKLRNEQIVNQYVITAQDGSIVKDLDVSAMGHDAETMIDCLNSCPPFFQPMALQETDWRPEDYIISNANLYSRYVCDKMTLEYGDYMIHLCSLESIKLGRSFSQNNIVINDWSNEASFADYPSRTVSKCHGIIRYLGDKIAYEDTSSFGTKITVDQNSYLVHQEQEDDATHNVQTIGSKCKLPERCDVYFGRIGMKAEIQTCPVRKKNAMCRNCMQKLCSGAILHRQDKLPEVFLFLWQCCDLGKVHPDLTGMTLFRRNDGYILQMEDGRLFVLAPEMSFPLKNGRQLNVSKFYQPRY